MAEQIVVLTVKSQKASGEKSFRLHKKRVVLGSATSSDVRLDDPAVSQIHAIFEVSGIDGKPVVYDLASETGITVNGKKVVQATLSPSDQIGIGPYTVTAQVKELRDLGQVSSRDAFGQRLFYSEKEDTSPLLLEREAEVHEIFDERPTVKQSLQVVMFYGATILDVEHFVEKEKVVIGPGRAEDFRIPPFLGEGKHGRFELVTNENGQYLLHLNDKMEGVISQNGKLTPVQDVITSVATATSRVYPLQAKDFAKIKFNDVSFFMNFSPAPPRLRFPKLLKRDPLFAKIWFTSLAFTLALITTFSLIHVDPKIEVEQLPERVATIIYEPKLFPVEKLQKSSEEEVSKKQEEPKKIKLTETPRTLKPAPRASEIAPKAKNKTHAGHSTKLPPKTKKELAAGSEGEGERAKGEKGSRGSKASKKIARPQTKALRPGKQTTNAALRALPGHSQTNLTGLVEVFKEAKGTLNKIYAGGSGAANSVNQLEGYSGFTSHGEGGLGEAGKGTGGGGKSLGLGGLSDKGAGGGRQGKGLGALGSGGNILGGTGKLAVSSGGSPEPIVLGGIDEDAIRRAIDEHRDEFKYCYEKEINAAGNSDLAGRIGVRWVIGPTGVVTKAGVSSSSLKNANVERCVVAVIQRIQFPPVRGGGIAEVTYPFVFKPSNK